MWWCFGGLWKAAWVSASVMLLFGLQNLSLGSFKSRLVLLCSGTGLPITAVPWSSILRGSTVACRWLLLEWGRDDRAVFKVGCGFNQEPHNRSRRFRPCLSPPPNFTPELKFWLRPCAMKTLGTNLMVTFFPNVWPPWQNPGSGPV